jgi:hypothetical protein
MNLLKYIVHFEYSLVIMNGLGTRMSTRKLIHTLLVIANERNYLTLRLVSSSNNPQNSEMKFYENMKLTC